MMSSYLNMIQAVTTRYNDSIKNQTSHFCEYFNVIHFWYNQISDKGTLSTISNHPEWSEYFADVGFYHDYPFLRHSKSVQEGVRVLNDFDGAAEASLAPMLQDGRKKYNMNVWITILSKVEGGIEEIGFSTTRSNISFILNEIGLVRPFVNKFREQNRLVFSKLEDNSIDLIGLIGPAFYEKSTPLSPKLAKKRAFLQKLGIDCRDDLTQREVEVIRLLLQGYSAGKIAPQLFLSKRTVEHHMERIKEKLGCESKTELIQKARELERYGCLNISEMDLE